MQGPNYFLFEKGTIKRSSRETEISLASNRFLCNLYKNIHLMVKAAMPLPKTMEYETCLDAGVPVTEDRQITAYLFMMGYFEIYEYWFAPYKSCHIIRVYKLTATWKEHE